MNTKHNSVNLENRILWFDGTSTVDADSVTDLIMSNASIKGLCVTNITPEIEQFNKLVPKSQQIVVKETVDPLKQEWNIPAEFAQMDVKQHILDTVSFSQFASDDAKMRLTRVLDELELYESMELMDVLRVLIYIINTLNRENVMWGVGRGSSVSSYVLYLLGVHDIDSVKYELDVSDFLRKTDTDGKY